MRYELLRVQGKVSGKCYVTLLKSAIKTQKISAKKRVKTIERYATDKGGKGGKGGISYLLRGVDVRLKSAIFSVRDH